MTLYAAVCVILVSRKSDPVNVKSLCITIDKNYINVVMIKTKYQLPVHLFL